MIDRLEQWLGSDTATAASAAAYYRRGSDSGYGCGKSSGYGKIGGYGRGCGYGYGSGSRPGCGYGSGRGYAPDYESGFNQRINIARMNRRLT